MPSVLDTLSLSWKSNGVYDRNLYPWKIINSGKTHTSFGNTSRTELRWIGGDVNSAISTRVFAYKKTTLLWELDRNGRRQELADTITCIRDLKNIVYFTY